MQDLIERYKNNPLILCADLNSPDPEKVEEAIPERSPGGFRPKSLIGLTVKEEVFQLF